MILKKRTMFLILTFLLCVIGSTKEILAAPSSYENEGSNTSIKFGEATNVKEPPVRPFTPAPPNVTRPKGKLLPQTGEILTSLIIMLVGISISVFVLGIAVLKQLFQEPSWEY